MDYYFQLKGLSAGYDGRPVVRNVNVSLEKGKILTLLGPNGSGKSTILKTMIRQLPSIEGAVYVDCSDVRSIDPGELAKKVSVMLTQRLTTDRMTCREVVETGRYPYTGKLGILDERDHRAVDDAMKLTNTADLGEKDFMRISDGQRQRLLFARAIAQAPQLLVLDEPTSYLDVRYKLELLNILRDLAHEEGITVVMSMHELDLAQRISDKVMCVKDGAITSCGSPDEIFNKENITALFDMDTGSYEPFFGSLEMKKISGDPRVFVIAGGGTGVSTFRALQRMGIPFAAGVLHEGDVDTQVAIQLASETVVEDSFSYIKDETFDKALATMKKCGAFINCLERAGDINRRNLELAENGKINGILEIDNLYSFGTDID
ncbi:ABC transporter ATP-binding protein [Mobilibacterium timonense]|uniref:ABC transporter ATP-binding protein n=1 Tax=Mobilibacterium timonense TaxID=1871012 RepID=UPI003A94F3F5